MDAERVLFHRLVDDAGQFPPARLGLDEAVAAHERARGGPHAWMLGRFLCPASRLRPGLPVPLGVIADGDWKEDLERAQRFGADAFELRDPGEDAYAELAAAPLRVFVEGAGSLAALARAGLGAKLRCGGTEPGAFPDDARVAGFIRDCRELELPFKATAGLHHPFRTPHRELGVLQHGFVNLLAATVVDLEEVEAAVAEEDPRAFEIAPDGLRWREARASVEQLARGRRLFTAFGSCSFDEPVGDLEGHGLLEAAHA